MAISFTQEDTTTLCSGANDCANGGTAGNTPVNVTASSSSNAFFSFAMQPGTTTWQAGTYTVNLDVTTANSRLTITNITILRRCSACVSISTLVNSAVSVGLGTAGVLTISGTRAADQTVSNTDILFVQLTAANSAMSTQSFSFTPDKTVDTPIASGPASLTLTGSDTVSAFGSSGSAVAGRIITATDTISAFTSSGTIALPTWVLSGSGTIQSFTSSASVVSGRIIAGADTVGAFVSAGSGSVVGQKTVAGTDTISAFTGSASAVAGRSVTGADAVAAFVSSGSIAFLVSLSAADAVAAFTSSASAVSGRIVTGSDTPDAFASNGNGTVTSSGSETLSGTDTIAPFVSAGALTLETTAPVPAGRHRRNAGRKRFGVEIDGRLIVADTHEELEAKYRAFRKKHPEESIPESPVIVPVPPAPAVKPVELKQPEPKRVEPLPEPVIDFALAKRAIDARLHIQAAIAEQERRKLEQRLLNDEEEQLVTWLVTEHA